MVLLPSTLDASRLVPTSVSDDLLAIPDSISRLSIDRHEL